MPRAVLLDLYHTLVDGGSDERWRHVNRAMGADLGVDPDRYAAAYLASSAQRFVGALGDLEATVRAVSVSCGVSPAPAAVRLAATRRLAEVRERLWPSAATLHALDRLRADGWRLGLVSNCSAETPTLWPSTPLAARFEAVGFSCALGSGKPDPAIFLAVCSHLGVAPTDCVFVGDGEGDELPAAANLGMSVIRTVEFVPSSSPWPPRRVGSLAELPDLLGVSGPPARSPMSAEPA